MSSRRNNILESVGLGMIIIALMGVFLVMNWKPEDVSAKTPDKITINKNVDRELLGKLPANKEDNGDSNGDNQSLQEVTYDYSDGGSYYYTGGIGGGASYTNTTPNSHTEQNTVANQTVVEIQAQEKEQEEKATEAKTTVAEKVLEVIYSNEFGEQTTETVVEEQSVVVTDDGTFGIVTTPVQDQNPGDTTFSGEDEREVIEMEVSFGDEEFTTFQELSVDGQSVTQAQ